MPATPTVPGTVRMAVTLPPTGTVPKVNGRGVPGVALILPAVSFTFCATVPPVFEIVRVTSICPPARGPPLEIELR